MRIKPLSFCALLGRVAEPIQQLLHVLQLALEVLLVALQTLDELLAVREAPPAEAAEAATVTFVMM
jgi:hypothetical protein